MAWTETDPMKERLHFVTDWDRRLYTVTELCARYGVSRKTGYKWLARYAHVGVAGLAYRSRRAWKHPGAPELVTAGPNDVWTADFKGHFRTGDGAYCYPLTVADQHSRYLLACDALASVRTEDSWLVFDRLFRYVGLPRAILTDYRAPSCSTGH